MRLRQVIDNEQEQYHEYMYEYLTTPKFGVHT